MNAPLQTEIELEFSGRKYGIPEMSLNERVEKEPPPFIGSMFIQDLLVGSAILALPEVPTQEQIIAAYEKDITAINTRRKEADDFLYLMLATALLKFDADPRKQQEEQAALAALLEPLGISAQIALTAERSASDPKDLAAWMKKEVMTEARHIARRVMAALDCMVERQVIGLVKWTNFETCKFHYFRWSFKHSQDTQASQSKVEKGWVSFTETLTETTILSRTRSTHHLVKAGQHLAKDYERPVPKRIKALLEKTPEWLRKNLLIIDGTETLVEEVTVVADKKETKTVSVVRYDPALTFGWFVFAGWNQEEIDKESPDLKAAKTERTETISYALGIASVIFALIGVWFVIAISAKWIKQTFFGG